MAASGKDGAGDAAAEWFQKCQLAFGERDADYVAAQRQVFHGVHARAVWAQGVERFVERARLGGNRSGFRHLLCRPRLCRPRLGRRGLRWLGWGWGGVGLRRAGSSLRRGIAAGSDAKEIGAEQQENGK